MDRRRTGGFDGVGRMGAGGGIGESRRPVPDKDGHAVRGYFGGSEFGEFSFVEHSQRLERSDKIGKERSP